MFVAAHPGIRYYIDHLLRMSSWPKGSGSGGFALTHVYLPMDVLMMEGQSHHGRDLSTVPSWTIDQAPISSESNETSAHLPSGAVSLLAMIEEEIAVR